MRYLYLDESGDLGFDFVNGQPSKYFTVCILAIQNQHDKKIVEKSLEKINKN